MDNLYNNKHLSLDDRFKIEEGIVKFQIAQSINKSPSTVAKEIKKIENLNLETLLMIILTIVFTLISVKFVLLSAKITKNFLVLEGTVLLVLVTIVLNYINVSWTSISTKLNLLMVIISIL